MFPKILEQADDDVGMLSMIAARECETDSE